ncbi:MAG: phosphopantetheine-binding protein [Eubacterium sp.]
MREKILTIIVNNAGDQIDWDTEDKIADKELIDSLDMVAIIGDLSEEFDIEISVDDMTAENFNSVDAIEAMVKRLSEEQN